MGFLYDLIYLIIFILYAPVLALRGKLHRGYAQRLGLIPPDVKQRLAGRRNIWVHAVSVGEVLAVNDIIRRIKNVYSSSQIVLTVVTRTGHGVASRQLGHEAVVIFAPLDLSGVVGAFIRRIRPAIYIAAETEIWPNLYRSLANEGVPIVQVNGRISERSFRGYRRIPSLMKKTLARVSLFCMQSPLDRERVIALGALPEKVHVTGNIKFDNLPSAEGVDKRALGYGDAQRILLAGSTHANEEEIILDIFQKLRQRHRPLKLILAPRHIERVAQIGRSVADRSLEPLLLSEVNGRPIKEEQVLLVDRIGVLRDLYSVADIVFIGKTLAVGGGQNMIEPAFFGKPTLLGPLTYNFKDVVSLFLEARALIQVRGPEELSAQIERLLADPQMARTLGANAKRLVEQYQGAGARTMELIAAVMKK